MADYKETIRPFQEEIKTGTSDSILASLYRTILKEIGITNERFSVLINKYIVRANIPMNNKDVSSTRGNLKKVLLKSTMTWKVFIRGLMFINVKKLDIAVRLYHANGKVTEHARTVVLNEEDFELDE